MHMKCYIHSFRLKNGEVYIRCSATGKMAKMEGDEREICPVCNRPVVVQTHELYPKVRTVKQIFSKNLDRWLTIEDWMEGGR